MGESEYIHKCGVIMLDTVIQRHLPKCHIMIISSIKELDKIYSSREDYVRYTTDEYDGLLLSPSWILLRSISFVQNKGPQILTFREHNNGCKKLYTHPPQQPNNILPSLKGDKLFHDVIKPRLIKPMKASKYFNTYQIHGERIISRN